MPEFEEQKAQETAPKKPRRNYQKWIAFALIGIFAVLLIANLDALMDPMDTLSSILAPVTIGLVLAYICNFFLRFFEYKVFYKLKRRTVNRAFSMLFTYLLVLAIIAGIVWLIIPSVIESVTDLRANGMTYINTLVTSLNDFLSKLPFPLPNDGTGIVSLEKLLNFTLELLGDSGTSIVTNVASFAGGALTVLKNIIVGIFISIYVLLSKEKLNAGCRRVFRALLSEKNEKQLLYYVGKAHDKFGGFLIGKLVDSTMVTLVCMLLFSIFDIPYAILIAVIIGVTDFIPFFGPFIGAIPSALIIFIADPMKAILFVLLILVVQQIDGNLIAPVILGDRTGLSSLGVIVAVTVMGGVLGIPGMLIGVPLFALIMTILDDFIIHHLKKKGEPVGLAHYYPADAFISPDDENQESKTLTQKFVGWVCSVENENFGPDEVVSRKKAFSRNIRRAFLNTGRFFYRIFSIKPLPEDHSGNIFADVAKHGMRTNRLFWRTFFLSIVTLLIYPFYLVEIIAQTTNIACREDEKRTWGTFAFITLGILTLGIYPLVWHCKQITRFRQYCERNGDTCAVSRRFYLCWTLLGLPLVVGPLIAIARFLRAYSQMCRIYNSKHTFPLTEDEIKELSKPLPVHDKQKPRTNLMEQIIGPMELPEIPESKATDLPEDITDTANKTKDPEN